MIETKDIEILGLYEIDLMEEFFYDLYDETKEDVKENFPEYNQEIQFAVQDGHVLFYVTKQPIENYL